MSIWTCAGQAGKHLPAALVDVEEMGLLAAKLNYRSQNEDSFDFFMESPSPNVDPDYLPDHEQTISVYRNNIRQFTGKIQDIQFTWDGGRVGWSGRAVGGWSELERIPLTASNSSYERPQGDLRLTLIDIINKAIAGGAQIALGTIATCFDIIPLTFRGLSCSAALIEALRFIPDAVTFFDYTGGGLPVLNIARRPTMPTRTYTFGVDEIARCNISPMAGQTPDRVVLTYATADINGIVTETTVTAGAGTAANQAVILADSGFADFTAKAIAGQQVCRTGSLSTASWADLLASDAALQNYCTANAVPAFTSGPGSYSDANSPTAPTSIFSVNFAAPVYSAAAGVSLVGYLPLVSGQFREWFSKIGISKIDATFKATFFLAGTGLSVPAWFADLPVPLKYSHTGFDSGVPAGKWAVWVIVDAKALLINRSLPVNTTLRDPGDYATLAPPATLASNLLTVQSFTPYRGRVTFTPWQAFARDLGGKCNFPGANPRIAAVGALAQEEEINLQTGVRELIIGQPSRTGLATLMSRFRRVSS